jgi:endonuclease/exonuclease/phosphatase family metal-dependent hydrolase
MKTFSLVSLNIFGLPLLAPPRRLRAIMREIEGSGASLACLQEVQTHAYLHTLRSACGTYEHHAFSRRTFSPEGGLLTLGRTPFESVSFIPYRVQGPWWSPERYLNKGVVLNTHLHLNPYGNWESLNRVAQIELAQIRQLAEVVNDQPHDALVVVCGDFNFPRGCFLYDELIARTGLIDPLADDRRPTWRSPLDLAFLRRFEVPYDLMLLRRPDWHGLRPRVEFCLDEKVHFEGRGAGYLSDHVGLKLSFHWEDVVSPAFHA